MSLASSFGRIQGIRKDRPLSNDEIMRAAPSIFADAPHESRSERYCYIPTSAVLEELRKEGFEPFFACQTAVRKSDKKEHTKHMLRLRHAGQVNGQEANEIILLNSHDGSSSYQMIAGMFRFVCANGMVCGDTLGDVRIRHTGNVVGEVIEGAYSVLDTFEEVGEQRDTMKSLSLGEREQEIFANAVLQYRYDDPERPAPVTDSQLLMPRRNEDNKNDLWSTVNRVQENMIKGGIRGRNSKGRRMRTRAVRGIDQDVKLNRAIWSLANEMAKLKA